MEAGKLNKQITLQAPTVTRGTDGSESVTYTDIATVWGSKEHKTSREFFAAQKINSECTVLFIIRYRENVKATWRVKLGDRYYDVIGAEDPNERRKELWLLCKEVV